VKVALRSAGLMLAPSTSRQSTPPARSAFGLRGRMRQETVTGGSAAQAGGPPGVPPADICCAHRAGEQRRRRRRQAKRGEARADAREAAALLRAATRA